MWLLREIIDSKHTYLKYTCPYQNPLWAIVEIDLNQQQVALQGRRTDWVGKSPTLLKMPAPKWPDADVRAPVISDREWTF